MKKYCAFILALVLLLATSCGSADDSDYSGESKTEAEPAPYTESQEYGSYPAQQNEGDMPEVEYPGDGYSASRAEGESYLPIDENPEKVVSENQMLTFSLKVDTASYTNVARYIQSGELPPKDAVRIEEMINYFNYESDMAFEEHPFSIYTELGPSPFDEDKYMAFIRVKAEDIDKSELPRSNLTFLIDTSGSMSSYDKLPLLKEAFGLLVETLTEDDVVSIVTYAGSAGVVLDSVSGADKERIMSAIQQLESGGSTAGAEGIETAYALAAKNYREGGNNRVILASDGDFNVGISSLDGLNELVSQKRSSGIYLSVLGFGTGNIRDDIMETLAKNGNGNYSYINSISTARKVLVEEIASNLFTIAEDVKAQVEFNPRNVKSYRLIGYENRMLSNQDFTDDSKDAGEIGVGTDVVVLFELELTGQAQGLKYSQGNPEDTADLNEELFEVRLRYKNPGEQSSNEMKQPSYFADIASVNTSDYRFASSVAAFGHLLRNSEYAEGVTIDDVGAAAEGALGSDPGGYRQEFLQLLQSYRRVV